MPNISNVHVGRHSITSDEWCLSWVFQDASYHIWLRPDLSPKPGVGTMGRELYKQKIGDGEVRYLHLETVPKNKAMFENALQLAKDSQLFEKCQQKLESEEKERLAKARAEYLIQLQRDAGPELFKVLKAIRDFFAANGTLPLAPGALILEEGEEIIGDAVKRVVRLAETGGAVAL